MANSFTTLGFTLPEVGADTNLWGGHINGDWTLADTLLQRLVGTTTTRLLTFNVNAVSTTTTRTVTWADTNVTFPTVATSTTISYIADLNTAQTFTNKSLTAPTLNGPTLISPNLGVVTSGNIAACTGFLSESNVVGGLAVDASTAVANTFVSGPTTGSIGANGYKYLISGAVTYDNTSGGNMTASARIWNGSTSLMAGVGSMSTGFFCNIAVSTIVTLTGATTFTLQATDNVGGNVGKQLSGSCWITAVRLA